MVDREPKKEKTVPLVMYRRGERIVIGQAIVKGDGSIEGQIAKDVRQELKDILFGDMLGAISVDPKPLPSTSTYINLKTNEAVEVAVIPPPKVQE